MDLDVSNQDVAIGANTKVNGDNVDINENDENMCEPHTTKGISTTKICETIQGSQTSQTSDGNENVEVKSEKTEIPDGIGTQGLQFNIENNKNLTLPELSMSETYDTKSSVESTPTKSSSTTTPSNDSGSQFKSIEEKTLSRDTSPSPLSRDAQTTNYSPKSSDPWKSPESTLGESTTSPSGRNPNEITKSSDSYDPPESSDLLSQVIPASISTLIEMTIASEGIIDQSLPGVDQTVRNSLDIESKLIDSVNLAVSREDLSIAISNDADKVEKTSDDVDIRRRDHRSDENPLTDHGDDDGDINASSETSSAIASTQQKPLDLDEDKKNPQYIPKKGMFYEHDDRLTSGDIDDEEENRNGNDRLKDDVDSVDVDTQKAVEDEKNNGGKIVTANLKRGKLQNKLSSDSIDVSKVSGKSEILRKSSTSESSNQRERNSGRSNSGSGSNIRGVRHHINRRGGNNNFTSRAENQKCWQHDLFQDDRQKPKSKDELKRSYGYDIRNQLASSASRTTAMPTVVNQPALEVTVCSSSAREQYLDAKHHQQQTREFRPRDQRVGKNSTQVTQTGTPSSHDLRDRRDHKENRRQNLGHRLSNQRSINPQEGNKSYSELKPVTIISSPGHTVTQSQQNDVKNPQIGVSTLDKPVGAQKSDEAQQQNVNSTNDSGSIVKSNQNDRDKMILSSADNKSSDEAIKSSQTFVEKRQSTRDEYLSNKKIAANQSGPANPINKYHSRNSTGNSFNRQQKSTTFVSRQNSQSSSARPMTTHLANPTQSKIEFVENERHNTLEVSKIDALTKSEFLDVADDKTNNLNKQKFEDKNQSQLISEIKPGDKSITISAADSPSADRKKSQNKQPHHGLSFQNDSSRNDGSKDTRDNVGQSVRGQSYVSRNNNNKEGGNARAGSSSLTGQMRNMSLTANQSMTKNTQHLNYISSNGGSFRRRGEIIDQVHHSMHHQNHQSRVFNPYHGHGNYHHTQANFSAQNRHQQHHQHPSHGQSQTSKFSAEKTELQNDATQDGIGFHHDEPIKTQTFENSRLAAENAAANIDQTDSAPTSSTQSSSDGPVTKNCGSDVPLHKSNFHDAREIINEKNRQRQQQANIQSVPRDVQNPNQMIKSNHFHSSFPDSHSHVNNNHNINYHHGINSLHRPITKIANEIYTSNFYQRQGIPPPAGVTTVSSNSNSSHVSNQTAASPTTNLSSSATNVSDHFQGKIGTFKGQGFNGHGQVSQGQKHLQVHHHDQSKSQHQDRSYNDQHDHLNQLQNKNRGQGHDPQGQTGTENGQSKGNHNQSNESYSLNRTEMSLEKHHYAGQGQVQQTQTVGQPLSDSTQRIGIIQQSGDGNNTSMQTQHGQSGSKTYNLQAENINNPQGQHTSASSPATTIRGPSASVINQHSHHVVNHSHHGQHQHIPQHHQPQGHVQQHSHVHNRTNPLAHIGIPQLHHNLQSTMQAHSLSTRPGSLVPAGQTPTDANGALHHFNGAAYASYAPPVTGATNATNSGTRATTSTVGTGGPVVPPDLSISSPYHSYHPPPPPHPHAHHAHHATPHHAHAPPSMHADTTRYMAIYANMSGTNAASGGQHMTTSAGLHTGGLPYGNPANTVHAGAYLSSHAAASSLSPGVPTGPASLTSAGPGGGTGTGAPPQASGVGAPPAVLTPTYLSHHPPPHVAHAPHAPSHTHAHTLSHPQYHQPVYHNPYAHHQSAGPGPSPYHHPVFGIPAAAPVDTTASTQESLMYRHHMMNPTSNAYYDQPPPLTTNTPSMGGVRSNRLAKVHMTTASLVNPPPQVASHSYDPAPVGHGTHPVFNGE